MNKLLELSVVKCWEYKDCNEWQRCPAYPNAGRICYAVNDTPCTGEGSLKYNEKIRICRQCEFYKALIIDKKI